MYNKLIKDLFEYNFRFLETIDEYSKEHIIAVEAEDGRMLQYTFDRKLNFISMRLYYSTFNEFLDSIATCTLMTGQFQSIVLHEGKKKFPIYKEEED